MKTASTHLAIFIPALNGGGAEQSMLKLADGFARRGYRVDLVLVHRAGPYLADVPDSVRLIVLNSSRDLFSLMPLVRYLRRETPEVLLSGLHTNIIALGAKRLARVPTRVVVSERNTLSQNVKHYSRDVRLRLVPHLVKWVYPWADAVVAVSNGVAADLARITGIPDQRIKVIYNPVVTLGLKRKAQEALEHPWFGSGTPPVVLAVGRLTPQKDFSTLITAFAQVRRVRPVRLLILGEGSERTKLESLVCDLGLEAEVSMPGFACNPYPYMRRASAFVLSSCWEGLPGVLIEAMYCGLPLVATDCPNGPREILDEGKYGRLVPVRDVNAIAQAIHDALDNKILPPPQEGWQRFEQEFIVDQYCKVLFGEDPQ
ncbi:MAG TPA: glycosyltransferase [Anaerolineales bacterium]|nr:glycosyltransferase [Anaerolineales bacterium]HLO28422.1 glycosyltransferase [Anaerolineales bacterium]